VIEKAALPIKKIFAGVVFTKFELVIFADYIEDMKRFLTLSCLLYSFAAFAQYSSQQIIKFKIAKITKLSATNGVEGLQKSETWYDEYGNDTAEYNNTSLIRRTKYEYNASGKLLSRIRYGADGRVTETAACTFKSDGTCVISNTDKSFGMTDLTFCDKAGKTTKTISPDKSERIYYYDSKGRLTKIKSMPGDNGELIADIQYSYDKRGQLIREVSKGDNECISVYTYNSKGMVEKIKRNSTTDGVADPEVTTTFEYEYRK
jgi:YD repeat-containing protein